jgi:hypothetical protein
VRSLRSGWRRDRRKQFLVSEGTRFRACDPNLRDEATRRLKDGLLAVRSLLEDGHFAGTVLKPFTNNWMATFEKCLNNAAASGDLREYPTTPHLSAWLLHHIALGLILHVSPRNPTDYKVPKHTLVRETVRFALRSIGLREEPIKRHYNSRFTCGVEK